MPSSWTRSRRRGRGSPRGARWWSPSSSSEPWNRPSCPTCRTAGFPRRNRWSAGRASSSRGVVRFRPPRTRPTNPPPAPQPAPTGPPQLGTTGPPQLGTTTPDEWVLVPGLVQRPLMDALSQVRSRRLRLEVAGGWPSGPERAGVAGQSPTEGTRVRIGTAVTVQISPPGQAMQPTPPTPQPPPAAAPTPQVSPPPPVAPPRPPARADLVLVPDLQQQLLPESRQLTTSARLQLRVRGQSPPDETRPI